MPAFEWVHVQLHQQKGMISLSPPTICNSALQRMKKETAQLYLLFFAFHRFQQINDNLIEALLHWVDQYEKQAKRAAEEAMNNAVTNAAKNLQAAGHVLSLFTDDTITDDTPFSIIKEKAYALLEQER
nr:hypothetical protein [Escherichia coli]